VEATDALPVRRATLAPAGGVANEGARTRSVEEERNPAAARGVAAIGGAGEPKPGAAGDNGAISAAAARGVAFAAAIVCTAVSESMPYRGQCGPVWMSKCDSGQEGRRIRRRVFTTDSAMRGVTHACTDGARTED
jgi:hypothetical protein